MVQVQRTRKSDSCRSLECYVWPGPGEAYGVSTCPSPAHREKGDRVASFVFSETLLKPQWLFVGKDCPASAGARELEYGVGSGPGVALAVVCSDLSGERRAVSLR